MLGQRRRRWANIDTALCEYPEGRVCWIAKWTRISPANKARQPNAGSTLVHCRRLWPSTIQHWTVLSIDSGVSTEYKKNEENLFISPQKYTIMIHMQNETIQGNMGKETSIKTLKVAVMDAT